MKVAATVFAAVFVCMVCVPAMAINITSNDGFGPNSNGIFPGSGPGIGIGQEDQETEPGTSDGGLSDQAWDLEAFMLQGTALSMVGGYNFLSPPQGYTPGDLFVKSSGPAPTYADTQVVNGPIAIPNTFGFDYVIDIDWAKLSYNVIGITAQTMLESVQFEILGMANPWKYNADGTENPVASGTFTQVDRGVADYMGLTGGQHYEVTSFDLSFLPDVDQASLHFTMKCGNDALRSNVADGGLSVLLLGLALSGVAMIRRRLN